MIYLGNLDTIALMSYERGRMRRIAPTIDNLPSKRRKICPAYCDYGQINFM